MNVETLSNGLIVIDEPSLYETVHFAVFIKAGTKHEHNLPNGTAHFLEHMLFKGTQNLDAVAISEMIDAIGGEVNAYTTKEYTCITIKTLERFEEKARELLIEMLFHSIFPTDEIEKEHQVILEEIKMTEDDKEDFVFEWTDELTLNKFYGQPILGTKDSLKDLKQEDLITYYQFYSPDNMIISYSGNHAEELKRSFSELTKKAYEKYSIPFDYQPVNQIKHVSDEQSHLLFTYEAVGYHHPLFEAFSLFSTFIGESVSSPLFRRLRDELALCYNVYSTYEAFETGGLFSIYIGCDVEHLKQAKLEIESLMEHYRTALTEVHLNKIKQFMITNLYMNNDYSGSRIMQYGRTMMDFDEVLPLSFFESRIQSVTIEDMNKVCQMLINPSQVVLLNSLQDAID